MNNMKMYIWKNWCDKIEFEEFEVIKETEKRYYYENGYVDKDKMNKWRDL